MTDTDKLAGRQPGEKMSAYLGRFSIDLGKAAIEARLRGDTVHAAFFAIKAAETLKLAKLLDYSLPAGETDR